MVKPGEISNFASSALFLHFSVVFNAVLGGLQKHTTFATHTENFYHFRLRPKIGHGPFPCGPPHDKRSNEL